jgi:hypothetical protein
MLYGFFMVYKLSLGVREGSRTALSADTSGQANDTIVGMMPRVFEFPFPRHCRAGAAMGTHAPEYSGDSRISEQELMGSLKQAYANLDSLLLQRHMVLKNLFRRTHVRTESPTANVEMGRNKIGRNDPLPVRQRKEVQEVLRRLNFTSSIRGKVCILPCGMRKNDLNSSLGIGGAGGKRLQRSSGANAQKRPSPQQSAKLFILRSRTASTTFWCAT